MELCKVCRLRCYKNELVVGSTFLLSPEVETIMG